MWREHPHRVVPEDVLRIGAIEAARLKRLVLIAPAGFGAEIGDGFLAGMLEAKDSAAIKTIMAELGGEPASDVVAEQALTRIAQHREQLAAMILEFQDAGWQSHSILDTIAKLKAPVTAIFGRNDTIISAHHAINAPRNVELRFTTTGGHVPHWADPAFIASLV